MSYQGSFDPTVGVPAEPVGGYLPGMYWDASAAGTIDGQQIGVGDNAWPIGATGADPWPQADVRWKVTPAATPDGWSRPPNPLGGCELVPGLHVIVDVFKPGNIGRTYGEGTYGSGVYGDDSGDAGWILATPDTFGIDIVRGAQDGSLLIPVDQCTLDIYDETDILFDLDPQGVSPTVGTLLRVSLANGDGSPADVVFIGRIERIEDTHDRPPRTLRVDAYGTMSDLVNTPATIPARPAEDVKTRVDALVALSGWWWKPSACDLPTSTLLPIPDPLEVQSYRQAIDVATWSGLGVMDTDRDGALRWTPWPYTYTGSPMLDVWDCDDVPGAIHSPRIMVVADAQETLNVAVVSNADGTGAEASDPPSIADFGRRSQSLGFPMSGLYANAVAVQLIADQAVTAYKRVVNRIRSFDLNARVDTAATDAIRMLDVGQSVRVCRKEVPDLPGRCWQCVVAGYSIRMTPGSLEATVDTTTTTETDSV